MNQPTKQGKTLKDPKERERILMMYGGIFRHNIPEFAKTLAKKNRIIKNLSR